jgi:uncharacterized repeat protein (TIGR01451 family)/fimbrial isopeptide formation D2 family protein
LKGVNLPALFSRWVRLPPFRAGACLLLAVCLQTAQAAPSISVSDFEFIPADAARDPDGTPNNGDEYMDSGGAWNGSTEVTNSTGDTFRLTLTNNAPGLPDPLVDDVAFDIALSLGVPTGFRLPASPFIVSTAASGGDAGAGNCIAPGGGTITATQAGGAGTPISFVFPANTNLPAQGTGSPCSYTLTFGLTTNNASLFPVVGNNLLNYTFTYNEIDNDTNSQQTAVAQTGVQVRAGGVIVTKTAVPNPADPEGAYADGETAEWTVSVFNNGTGGAFATVVTDTPNGNFDLSSLQLIPPALPPGTPFPVPQGNNQYTIAYLNPGQRVDITVQAEVAVPSGTMSCPDLRNDVAVQDRLGNTSSAFDSVVLDLQDPLLNYNPPNFAIDFGSSTTVSFTVSNPGLGIDGGTARNIRLAANGLTGVTISAVSPEWIYDEPTTTFIHVGADTIPGSGDEIISNGGSSLLQFNAEMSTCGGPTGGFLTWIPTYENICGLEFTPPIRSSTYSVNNFPDLTINKNVAPAVTNFGQPAAYTINLAGINLPALSTVPGVDNDWQVTDTLPLGVGNGIIPAVPSGTIITIGATTFTDADTNVPVTAGDTIIWEGDRDDLLPTPPSITIDFTVDSTNFCPPDPPITITNTANLLYPSCNINVGDSAAVLVNDSPIDSADQVFGLAGGLNPPFETGRPDTNLIPGDEPNEGERITFIAGYQFPTGYPGVWSGSAFSAEMGAGAGGLLGAPLQLAFIDGNSNNVPDTGEITGVIVEVINLNGPNFGPANLPVGAGGVTINPAGDIVIDLAFIEAAIGSASMAETTLNITYHVTAPEGGLGPDLQPVNDINVGILAERATLSVTGNPNNSCAGNNDFTQGIVLSLERAQVFPFGTIDNTNDAGACGVTTANLDIIGPTGILSADNIRILLDGADYELPTVDTDFIFGGAGNLAGLNKTFDFSDPDNVEIEVTPDTDNLTGNSTIQFPVTLKSSATTRLLPVTIFYDSNHTSPDFDGNPVEAYNALATLIGPDTTANLNVEFFPPSVILGDPVNFADVDPGMPGLEGVFNWLVRITNVGNSTVSDYVFTNEVPPGFLPYREGSSPVADAGVLTDPIMVWSSLPDLVPGGSVEIRVSIGLPQNAGCNVANPNQTTVYFGCTDGSELFAEDGPEINFPVIDLQLQHLNNSFCELCREGFVDLVVRNEGASDLYNVTVTEALAGSGLEYAGRTDVFPEGAPSYTIAADPNTAGDTTLNWDSGSIPELGQLYSDLSGPQPTELMIRFYVRSSAPNPENLLAASRQIQATANFDLFCGDPGLAPVQDTFIVPLRQPEPDVEKFGRNYSASQNETQYSDPVFGGTDDIVVWRVNVQNSGAITSADLEDLLVNDTIGGNFTLRYICPSEAAATSMSGALETALFAANPAPAPAFGCVAYTPSFDVDDPFGNPGNDEPGAFIDVARGQNASVYYVGEIAALCTNHDNDADIEWGCEVAPPAGGINASTPGVVSADDNDSAEMSTEVDPSGVQIAQTVTGVNPAQPLGTKGIVTITITNNSGGTIRNLVLDDILPQDYELDTTWFAAHPVCSDRMTVNTAYGSGYRGMVDICTHSNNGDPDGLVQPEFSFTSSTQGTVNQQHLLRNGDQLVLTLGIVRINPFDAVNNPEVREENVATASDPNYPATGTNTLDLQFGDTCIGVFNRNNPLTVNIDPEDLDVDINPSDPNLLFILSDPTATLDFDVVLTNNGGHDATDYDAYVTVGNGIGINILPADCTLTPPPAEIGFPPTNPGGILPPAYNPADSRTYRCVLRDPLPPGQSDTFSFEIERALPLGMSGDLTFRADVLGRTTLSDGSDPPDRGNAGYPYYSKDNILARIIGFNLRKNLSGDCSEDNPPPIANTRVQIGEECTFQVEAEWFGFATPGFGNIEIQNARIWEGSTANNPPAIPGNPPTALDGQGFIDLAFNNSTGVTVNTQNPAVVNPLDETGFMWLLNNITAVGNEQEEFVALLRTRTLNDPIDVSAAPNIHAALRRNEVNASFGVSFDGGPPITFDETVAGYPPAILRRVNLRVTEPSVAVNKQVCNETDSIDINGPAAIGPLCAPFVTTVQGDSNDLFIYRLTATNAAAAGGFARAPAYNVIVTDDLDPTDQLTPQPLALDGIDNDDDGVIDENTLPDTIEGTITDNAPPLGDRIVFSYTHSTALERINPGESVNLYYRSEPVETVVPQQVLTNTAFAVYDSLEDEFGNQSLPLSAINTIGSARSYQSPDANANLQIDDVVLPSGSKRFSATSRRDDPGGPVALPSPACTTTPCIADNVVVGEEVIIDLVFEVPPATLNNFVLTDNLPPGLECIELLDVVLPTAAPDAEFLPGGTFGQANVNANDPGFACDQNLAQWNFGNQSLIDPGTVSVSADGERYVLTARFVARVLNTAQNNNADVIANGGGVAGGGTEVTLVYNDANSEQVTQVLDRADLTVQEPLVQLQKFFGFPNPSGDPPPNLVDAIANADQGDIITVEVYAENTGTSPAYNLTIVDALSAIPNLEIVTVSGDPVLSGPNLPDNTAVVGGNVTFTFAPNNPVPVGGAFNFGFQVRVIGPPAPETVIGNTINASWTSLPDDTIALNSGGAIGADGAANGLRNGQIPPDGGINDYEANATADFAVPNIDIVKTDLNPVVPPTIGQRKNYQIQLLFPESNADNVVVSDNLASGDVTFVLENNATFDVTYSCSGIATINSVAVNCGDSATIAAALIAEPLDQSTGTANWNFGTVLTEFENDALVNNIGPEITINYFARINNDLDTDAGDLMQNGAQVTYAGSTGPFISAAPQITVVEPLLNVAKVLTPPGTPPDGGDTLTYTVTIQNVGGSTAFDANIVDTLSDGLEFSQTTSALLDAAVIPGFNITPQGTPGGPLIWGRGQTPSDETLDIPAGSTFVLVYEVTVDDTVAPEQPLSNSVLVDWTSLDGLNVDERTGDGCPVITAPNDYCSAPQTTSIDAGNNNFITKTRTDDTYPGTPDDVRIGDLVQYTLAVNLQEGRIPNVSISDVLPAGMEFVRTVSINGDIAAPFSASAPFIYADIPLANTPAAPATNLTWTIGQVTNAADNNPANDVLIIVYEARVIDHVAIPFPATGSSTDPLLNTAALNYRLYDDVTDATPQIDTETIFVQQPLIELATISKLRTDTGDVMVTAGQTIEFTLQVCNIGTAPAYDLVISDTLPAELNDPNAPLPDPDVVSVIVGGVDRTAIYDESGPGYNFAASVIRWTFDNDALPHTAPNNCVEIVYRVNVDPEVGAGATFSNAMQVDVYYSRDDDDPFEVATRRTYPPVGPVSVAIMSQTPMGLEKDGPLTATPGDVFSYTLTFPDTPAITTLYDVLIEDDLPPGITYINSTFGTGNGAVGLTDNTVTGSNNVRLSLDTVPAGEQAVININVRLNNTVGPAGTTITNTANYLFAASDGGPSNIAGGIDDHTLTVIEPQPQITKAELGPVATPGADGFIDLGIPEQFSLTIENNLPNASTLWQATIVDELPDEMRAATPPVIDAISIDGRVLSEDAPDDYDVLYDSNTGLFQIVLKSLAARIEPGEVLTIIYTAGLIDDAGDALAITNRSLVGQWFSQDTSAAIPPDTRTYNQALGDGTPAVAGDDYAHDLTLTTRAPVLTMIKDVINLTSGLNPGIAAAPGDTLEYTITVNNAGTLGTIFSIIDEIDALNVPGVFTINPGSLIITSPIDPLWINNSDASGGVNGSGLIDIENITISELAGGNNVIQIVFEATLQTPLPNGTIVANQAILSATGLTDILSDDPNRPGTADPTLTIIGSAPSFIFEKISDDLTGDPAILNSGDVLRYTITVKNTGDANTVNARLTDQIPANTSYVVGSTTLNGAPIADVGDGISPLQNGMLINSPDVTTPGVLTANADPAANNVVTITFDVTINTGLVNGTIISNQASMVGEILQNMPAATPTPFLPVFSDDPDTEIVNDPTQDVVGFGVNIDAHKTVLHLIDQDSDGEIEPGDTLRYSITIVNNGNIDAGDVIFIDDVPVQTTYVPNSTMLDTVLVPDSAGQSQVSSAQGGLSISMPASASAVVIFDVTVNAVAPGTVISNQGVVTSAMQPDELTDADGNDENGDQPTIVVVGNFLQLDITKEVAVVGGGVVTAGGELEYIITVTNTSSSPVNDAIITDNIPAGTALVAGSALLNGFNNGVIEAGASITANHGATYGDLASGERFTVRFRVRVNDGLPVGTPISNTATVTWNSGADSASDTANVDVGGTPGAINLNGRIWLDPDHDALFDQGVERTFEGWTVRVYFNNANPSLASTPIATLTTDTNGEFAFNGLAPGGPYTLTYAVPEGDATYPPGSNIALGFASASVGTGELMRINAINAQAGRNIREQNLPVDPNGVVYNSITRVQVPSGARVSLRLADNNQPVPASCYDTPAHLDSQEQQIIGPDGFYRFDLNFANAGCPSGAVYRIVVELSENGGFIENVSTIIPPEAETFNTVNCTVDFVPTTLQCEVQALNTPPAADIPPGPGTAYYLDVLYASNSQMLSNNHIPVDDVPDGLLNVAKTTPLKNVVRGDLVPYTITIANPQDFTVSALIIRDVIPPGFKYIERSARLDGVPAEPDVDIRVLTWSGLSALPGQTREIKLLLVVGAGVSEGEYINTAQAFIAGSPDPISGLASATVRVVPDPTFDCSDIIGRVFEDVNANGYPDDGEPGIAGARIATAKGLLTTADEYGRFHIVCALVPNQDRGSNFILKLDERSLPSGYRVTTENPRVQRLTRGKVAKFNFGATMHRVVRLDLANAAFEPGSANVHEHWQYAIDGLIEQLQQGPSVLRISYLGDSESEPLVKQRIRAVKQTIQKRWKDLSCCYNLEVETEIFWRTGKPGGGR